MAGQSNLQTAAQRRAIDRRGNRLAHRFQASEGRLDARDLLLEPLRVGGGCLNDHVEIGTGEEGLLGAGDDHTGNVILLRIQAIQCRLE